MAEIDYDGPRFEDEDPVRYPWAEWLDGAAHVITDGQDVDDLKKFRGAVHTQSRRRNLTIITRPAGAGKLIIKALPDIPRGEQ